MGYYYHADPPPSEVRVIDDALYAQWVADGNPKADWWVLIPDPPTPNASWDGTQWVVPPPPPPPPLSRLGFLSRFTDQELVNIEVARQTAASVTDRATLTVLKESWMAANDIDVTDPRTIQGVGILVQAGLLTQARADEILAPVT